MTRFIIFCVLACGFIRYSIASEVDLTGAIDTIRREHEISAAAYFIVSPDSIEVLQSLGHPSWDATEPFEVDHLVRIGSITKTFTALGTMILVERGVLSLQSPVRDTLPEPPFYNSWARRHPVRIAHLMEHTAGLRDLSPKEFSFNEPASLNDAFRVDPDSRRTAWEPGLHSSYSNSGAGILSAVIEQVTGKSYESFVAVEIFAPLGMASARFSIDPPARDRLIAGYDSDGRTPIKYWHTLYRAFGGISVTPRDMIPFVQLFLNRGKHTNLRLLSEATIARMQRPATTLAARGGLNYGYGLGIYQFQHRGVSFYGHGGDADGYLAFFAYTPTLNRGYFVVINAFNKRALGAIRRVIEDEIVGDRGLITPPVPHLSEAQRKLLSGTYRQATQRFARRDSGDTIEIIVDAGKIYSSGGPSRRRSLLPLSAWHFRRPEETVATIAFVPCGDRIYLQGDFGNYAKLVPGGRLAACP